MSSSRSTSQATVPTQQRSSLDEADRARIIEALRRSSSSNDNQVTRTLYLTATERSSRDNTPTTPRIDLIRRPLSNPRSRTPMRYESPLESDAFRRRDSQSPVHEEPRLVLVRPHPFEGNNTATNVIQEQRAVTPKSHKQGPSHRKVRRWNNEHFVNLASELPSATADVFVKAQKDAHLYKAIYDPKEHQRSELIDRFMNDDTMKAVRNDFFEGEGPVSSTTVCDNHRKRVEKPIKCVTDMMNRLDPRLRRLVVRACRNSYAASKVVQVLEEFILNSFSRKKKSKFSFDSDSDKDWYQDLLLECPTVTKRRDGKYTAQFFFHATSNTGGFHRLLLTAICKFHGLHTMSRTVHHLNVKGEEIEARALIVTGEKIDSHEYRMFQYLSEKEETVDGSL